MAFIKEHIKIGGRTKGTPNKCNGDVKKLIASFVTNEFKSINTLLSKADAETRLNFIAKLLPYVLPKMQDVSIKEEQPEDRSKYDNIEITDEMRKHAEMLLMARHEQMLKNGY